MAIWQKTPEIGALNKLNQVNMLKHLDIQITKIGDDVLEGSMPVDHRTKQPFGLLHGGASCVLAETIGSIAANLCINSEKYVAVGMEISAKHLRPATSGVVTAKAKLLRQTAIHQKWQIPIYRDDGELICRATLHVAIIEKKKLPAATLSTP